MTFPGIKAAVEDLVRKTSSQRTRHIAGVEVQTTWFKASRSIGIFVQGRKVDDVEEAASLIWEMYRSSGLA